MLVIVTLLLALLSLAFVTRITINKPQPAHQPKSVYRPLLEQGVILYHALATSRIEDIAAVQQLSEAAADWEKHVHKRLIDAGIMTNTTDK